MSSGTRWITIAGEIVEAITLMPKLRRLTLNARAVPILVTRDVMVRLLMARCPALRYPRVVGLACWGASTKYRYW